MHRQCSAPLLLHGLRGVLIPSGLPAAAVHHPPRTDHGSTLITISTTHSRHENAPNSSSNTLITRHHIPVSLNDGSYHRANRLSANALPEARNTDAVQRMTLPGTYVAPKNVPMHHSTSRAHASPGDSTSAVAIPWPSTADAVTPFYLIGQEFVRAENIRAYN